MVTIDAALPRVCFECGREWPALPAGFIDQGQPLRSGWMAGYCQECAAILAELHDAERYGTERCEQYLIECERYEDGRPY